MISSAGRKKESERVYIVYEGHTKNGKTFRNCEVHTTKEGKLITTEVYFGWDLPHAARPGGFIEGESSGK